MHRHREPGADAGREGGRFGRASRGPPSTSIFGGVGGSACTILDASQAVRQILYGLIVLVLAAIYARAATSE